ncbi:MAG: calcium/proton exchanger [Halanaerobiales bacterium]
MKRKIYYLLVFVPASMVIYYFTRLNTLIFIFSALSIIPLAVIMTSLTRDLANILGNSRGGLLNVTFGNGTELIIAFFAINKGLLNVVKAEITGSILMNLLLIPGLSFFAGGIKYRSQSFDKLLAITNSAMLMLAAIGMLVPAIFYFASSNIRSVILGRLSLAVGFILLIIYFASLYFTMVIHEKEIGESITRSINENNIYKKIGGLLLITVLISLEAKFLVETIEGISEFLQVSPDFIGIIVLPLIANVAENYTAIKMARDNNIDMSINIAIGSSVQVALFLVPILIFMSHLLKQPMNVLFNILEVSSIFMAVLAINVVYLQGKSNWLEGLQLCAIYLIIAVAFFFA